jgi:Holliday junction resolvase RusA-like endonuclease
VTVFACTLPGAPVPQGRPRVWRNGAVGYPKRVEAAKKLAKDLFWVEWIVANGGDFVEPLSGPLRVSLGFAGARANADLDNLAKLVVDALVDAGVLAGDDVRTVAHLDARVIAGAARTEVTVERIALVEIDPEAALRPLTGTPRTRNTKRNAV